jgi:hypothetical protein
MLNYRYLFSWLLLVTLSAPVQASEELHYRLSYSGLVTGYIWKELADVTLDLTPEETEFHGQSAVRIRIGVTSENYSVAEAIHALRYQWESILSPDLQRTLLVRVIDQGDSDSNEVYWYDWQKKSISLYRKREQHDVSIPMFDEEAKLEWEKDRFSPAPEFIDAHPAAAPGLGYLVQSEQISGRLNENAIDPLTMLLRLRQHNYREQETLQLQIINEGELAPYQARLIGTETLQRGNCSDQTLKIEVRRGDDSGEQGSMTMWLSDDEQRQPLRIDVDASLGMLHIELETVPSTCSHSLHDTGSTPVSHPHSASME